MIVAQIVLQTTVAFVQSFDSASIQTSHPPTCCEDAEFGFAIELLNHF